RRRLSPTPPAQTHALPASGSKWKRRDSRAQERSHPLLTLVGPDRARYVLGNTSTTNLHDERQDRRRRDKGHGNRPLWSETGEGRRGGQTPDGAVQGGEPQAGLADALGRADPSSPGPEGPSAQPYTARSPTPRCTGTTKSSSSRRCGWTRTT